VVLAGSDPTLLGFVVFGFDDFLHHHLPGAPADLGVARGEISAGDLPVDYGLLLRFLAGVQQPQCGGGVVGFKALPLAGESVEHVETHFQHPGPGAIPIRRSLPEFWINVTVVPGAHRARLKFAERRAETDPQRRPMTVSLNGQSTVQALDVAARAGGLYRVFDLDFAKVRPSHGVIEMRLSAPGGEGMLQALEISPSGVDGGK